MRELLAATFAALLMVGCGGDTKKPAGDSLESNESSAETPTAKSPEVAKVVVDGDQIEFRGGIIEQDGLAYFEGKPFTGVAVWKYTAPNPNGQKWNEITYKDGRRISITVWKPNGEKCPDTNLVNGNGIICDYHDNGQKEYEATWKDGKFISVKSWDADGNPI